MDARHSQVEAKSREAVEDILLRHGGPNLHAFVSAPVDKRAAAAQAQQQAGRGGAPGAAELRERAREAAEAVHQARGDFSFTHG